MHPLGPQCASDDPFRKQCRLHQSVFRSSVLKLPFDTHGNVLTEADAKKGANFYDGYGVFTAVQKKRKYAKPLYANLLRSEHIPHNIFIPFKTEKALFAAVMSEALGIPLVQDACIKIEYAPKPATDHLRDNTSFDVFCDCKAVRGNNFFLGIEVKYTEQGYAMGVKEREFCKEPSSPYNKLSLERRLYNGGRPEALHEDRLRQFWRNHLLAESLFCKEQPKYKFYRSITLYPEGNEHIDLAAANYRQLLSPEKLDTFAAITLESLFGLIEKHAKSSEALAWVGYLKRRYIPETAMRLENSI